MIRKFLEFTVFVGLALAVHFGAWWRTPTGDLGSSGQGGTEALSLTAISPSVAAMVEALEQPPEIDTAEDTPDTPQEQPAPKAQDTPMAPPLPAEPVHPVDRILPDLAELTTPGVSLPSFETPPEQIAPPEIAEVTPQVPEPPVSPETPEAPERPARMDAPQPPEAMPTPQASLTETLPEVAPPPPPPNPVLEATLDAPAPQRRPERPDPPLNHSAPPRPRPSPRAVLPRAPGRAPRNRRKVRDSRHWPGPVLRTPRRCPMPAWPI